MSRIGPLIDKTRTKIAIIAYSLLNLTGFSRITRKSTFTAKVQHSLWGGQISKSGKGSDPENTASLRKELPLVLSRLEIQSIIDAPCGDFSWQPAVFNGPKFNYLGLDIVEQLVNENNLCHASEHIKFRQHDICSDKLIYSSQLIICRDCLVHLSFQEIRASLIHFCDSDSLYLLTTTFISPSVVNKNIVTGAWRPLNLALPPFSFPEPILSIPDHHFDNPDSGKTLGLWLLSSLENLPFLR